MKEFFIAHAIYNLLAILFILITGVFVIAKRYKKGMSILKKFPSMRKHFSFNKKEK
jgi:hypothetical protein